MSGKGYRTVLVQKTDSVSVHGLYSNGGNAEAFAAQARLSAGVLSATVVEINPATIREIEAAQ